MITEVKNNELYWAKVKPDAIIPTKDKENAGYDIYACFEEAYIVIPPHGTKLVPTGIAAAVSPNYYLQAQERGSTGSVGMKYGAGVIDSSYRGQIFICINNINDETIIIGKELSLDDLFGKYGKDDGGGYIYLPYDYNKQDEINDNDVYECDDEDVYKPIYHPYSKAIAQLIVHDVHEMDEQEITYEELKNIPSKRGTGALGSSGK